MNGHEFLDKMELIDPAYVEAADAIPTKKKKNWGKWSTLAACLCLVVIGAVSLFGNDTAPPDSDDPSRSDSSGGSGTAHLGGIFDGVCYYARTDGSFWRYTVGGTSELLFSDRIFDYAFTETGVYYTRGLCFYFRPYSGGEAQLLYSPSDPEADQVRFAVRDDGGVVLSIYDLRDHVGSHKPYALQCADSILIDGETGEILETLYEDISFEESIAQVDYAWQSFRVGDRTIRCIPDESLGGVYYDVVENGQSLLPEGARTDGRLYRIGDGVLVTVYDDPASSPDHRQLYLLTDGRNIDIGSKMFETDAIGKDERYLLYFHEDGKLGAYDIETGETWPLGLDADIMISDSVTDGTHLYSTYYGSGKITLWELTYDESGKPTGMKLLAEDICS